MKLKDIELVPGVVINANDPEHIGRVKAVVPGIFDTSMSEEALPWIHPLTMAGYQQFSKLQRGSGIWLFKNMLGDMRELWYIPMFQLYCDASDIVSMGKDSDIIFSRIGGPDSANFRYVAGEGMVMNVGDDNSLSMKSDGTMSLKSGGTHMSMGSGRFTIGDPKSAQNMVLGNNLTSLLENLKGNIEKVASIAASTGGDVSPLSTPLSETVAQLDEDIKNILSSVGKVS